MFFAMDKFCPAERKCFWKFARTAYWGNSTKMQIHKCVIWLYFLN